jgi:hypothetical protein
MLVRSPTRAGERIGIVRMPGEVGPVKVAVRCAPERLEPR